MMTAGQLEAMYGTLAEADADADAETLARICWQLYAELGQAVTRAGAQQARFAALVRAAAAHGGGQACPGCRAPGQAAECAWCGQMQDPCCGYGLEYTPPSADAGGQWRCTGCRAIAADDPLPAGAPS